MNESTKRKAWIIAYGSGDMGYQFLYDFFKNFQNFFLTNIAGFSTGLTASIISITNIFKIFFSPTTGIIIDKQPFGIGKDKFTPWVKLMPTVLSLLFILMAGAAWKGMSTGLIVIFFVGAYVLNLFLFNAYRGAIPSISRDENEASFVTTAVNLWKEVGRTLAGVFGPLLVIWFSADKVNSDGQSFFWTFVVFGIATIVTYAVSTLGITKTINPDAVRAAKKNALSFGMMMKQVFTNVPLLIVFIATCFSVVRYFVLAPIAPYFFTYVIGDLKQMAWYSAATQFAGIGATFCAPLILKYVIKDVKKLYIIVMLGMIIPHLCLYLTGTSLWGFNIMMTIAQAFYSLASVYQLVLFVAAVDFASWKAMKNGEPVADGTSMSMYFTAVMIAQVIGASIRNWGLSLAGYAGKSTVASAAFSNSLVSLMAWLPAACCGVALIAFLFYSVDAKKLSEIRAELAQMKAQKAN